LQRTDDRVHLPITRLRLAVVDRLGHDATVAWRRERAQLLATTAGAWTVADSAASNADVDAATLRRVLRADHRAAGVTRTRLINTRLLIVVALLVHPAYDAVA
jgi:hypothetical protein